MVLRPITELLLDPSAAPRPAWEVVSQAQAHDAGAWFLFTQAEHARLSGELARQFDAVGFELSEEAIGAIGLHDEGWAPQDAEQLAALASGGQLRPVSFSDASPQQAVRAWVGSIERVGQDSPLAGAIVSRHFWRLARVHGEAKAASDEERRALVAFLRQEQRRQYECLERAGQPAAEMERLTDVLQFCDLLSLYLVCGTRAAAQFAPHPGLGAVRAQWRSDACELAPFPFHDEMRLSAAATRFPGGEQQRFEFVVRKG